MNKYLVTLLTLMMFMPASLAQTLPAGQGGAPMTPPTPAWTAVNFMLFRLLPVQHAGRIMPVDTLARQTVWEVTGKRDWQGLDPAGLLLAWTWQNDAWQTEPIILVGHPDLQKHLAISADRKHFSCAELLNNQPLHQLVMEAQQASMAKAALSPLQRSAAQVWQRLSIFQELSQSARLRIVPAMKEPNGAWSTVADIASQPGLPEAAQQPIRAAWDSMHAAFLAGDRKAFIAAAQGLDKTLTALNAVGWPNRDTTALEFIYNWMRPFRAGWIATFLALAVGLLALAWPNKWVRRLAWVLLLDGFALLTTGIVLRWKFSGHAPLATMYESLVFMGWGVTIIGIIVMLLNRQRIAAALPIVAGVATAILIVADASSLDSAAEPLQPVLRNTAWLTIHVLTIMMAYSAYALAMGLGHVQAVRLALKPQDREPTAQLGRLLYAIILTGCAFLTAGIIFGAIWASESWGRPWGWDPKETWSLITLLGYMVVLHGRRINWFGPFGDAVASIVCFQLVVMTYYGVNFVLGQGLHSYGFSAGGQIWIGLYVLAELVFVAWTSILRRQNARLQPSEVAATQE